MAAEPAVVDGPVSEPVAVAAAPASSAESSQQASPKSAPISPAKALKVAAELSKPLVSFLLIACSAFSGFGVMFSPPGILSLVLHILHFPLCFGSHPQHRLAPL
jgi:hypothetical protein